MQAKLSDPRDLKRLFTILKDLVDHANVTFSERGLHLQVMDGSQVALVGLTIYARGFEEYICERTCTLGFQFECAETIMKKCKSDQSVTMIARHGETEKFDFAFDSKGGRNAVYTMKLLDIDSQEMTIPPTEVLCEVKTKASEWASIIRNLASIGDVVEISLARDKIMFKTRGTLIDGSEELPNGGDTTITFTGSQRQNYSLKYLSSFCKATDLSDKITVVFSRDAPLKEEFEMENFGVLTFYLAPKIDDSD